MRTTSLLRRATVWIPWGLLALAVLCGLPTVRGPLPTALAEDGSAELEANRRLLEKWRADPVHYERLQQDLLAFLALPPEAQDRLRKLDHDLHAEESAVQSRLWRALERYAAWLERLPPEKRQQIEAASNGIERRREIRKIRQQQWFDRLPEATQLRLKRLTDDERAREIVKLQSDEKRQRQEWKLAALHWDEPLQPKRPSPARFEEIRPKVRHFVDNVLVPLLTAEERRTLKDAEGEWPHYPRILVELADSHPVFSPGAPKVLRRIADLPEEMRHHLSQLKRWPTPEVKKAEGRWPDFSLAVARVLRNRKLSLPKEYWPARPEDFPSSLRLFLDKELEPALTADERTRYDAAKGQWPEFPRLVLQLSRAHRLVAPGMMLPGPRELWDRFRTRPAALLDEVVPEVPLLTLQQFAEELTPRELADLRLTPMDPTSLERLAEEWKKRYPKDWQQLLQQDRQKRLRKLMQQ